jgi:hypothetical protein
LTGSPPGADVRRLGAPAEEGHGPGTARSAERRAGAWGEMEESVAPYVAAVSVTAEAEANLIDQTPAASHAPWIKPIGDYERKKTTTVEGLRYG